MIADIPPLNERHKFIRDMKPSFQHFDLNKLSICQIILDRQLFDFNLLVKNAISPGIIYSFCGGNISVVLKSVENNNVTWDLELNKNIINHDIKIYNFDNRIFSEYRLKVEQNLKKEQIYIINKCAPCVRIHGFFQPGPSRLSSVD
jgi:hypothetical protein